MEKYEIDYLSEMYDVLFYDSQDIILIISEKGDIVDANLKACKEFHSTLAEIRTKKLYSLVKEQALFKEFLEKTFKEGRAQNRFTLLLTPEDNKGAYHELISTLIKSDETAQRRHAIIVARNIHSIVESDEQRQFFYELFQHDLLNKLHAQIGYIDFTRRILELDKYEMKTILPMFEKMRDITVKSIYLIQNANMILMIKESSKLSNREVTDVVQHAIRYLQSFFLNRISVEVVETNNYVIQGNDYSYRVIVNLLVRLQEYASKPIKAEIIVSQPTMDEGAIKIRVPDIVLTSAQKNELTTPSEHIERTKLDIAVLHQLIKQYHMRMKVTDLRKSGELGGIIISIYMPIVDFSIPQESNE